MVNFIANNGTQILFKKARERMEQINTRKTKKTEIMSAVSGFTLIFYFYEMLYGNFIFQIFLNLFNVFG